MNDLKDVVNRVKDVDDGLNNIIVPILKDSIKDGNQHNKRLFVIDMMLILALVIISITSMIIITKQDEKYAEFLSQFEFEEVVSQNVDNNSAINSGININK